MLIVPPLCTPAGSGAGPFACGSVALCCAEIFPVSALPESFLDDGLPQPVSPRATAAVAATATLKRLAISPLSLQGVDGVTVGCGDRKRLGSSHRGGSAPAPGC